MIIGPSGVGKSTLINELYGEYLAEEGSGKKYTTKGKKYISDKIPFMSLIDTVGAEIGKEHTLEDVEKDTLNIIQMCIFIALFIAQHQIEFLKMN
jgi:predicted GTPase